MWVVTGLQKRVHSGYRIYCNLTRCNRSNNLSLIIDSDKSCGVFFIFSSPVHEEMCLPHELGHYSLNFIWRKQQNRQNNLLRLISLDLHTLTNASVWIHIQLAKVLKLNIIIIRSPNFQKFSAGNIQFAINSFYFLFYS